MLARIFAHKHGTPDPDDLDTLGWTNNCNHTPNTPIKSSPLSCFYSLSEWPRALGSALGSEARVPGAHYTDTPEAFTSVRRVGFITTAPRFRWDTAREKRVNELGRFW